MSYTETDRDMDTGIFRPEKPSTPAFSRRKPIILGEGSVTAPVAGSLVVNFDVNGRPTDNTDRIFARSTVSEGKSKFEIKAGTSGPNQNKFADPLGMYFTLDDLLINNRRGGKALYEFVRVSQTAFDDYIHYLQRRDAEFLRRSERSSLDG